MCSCRKVQADKKNYRSLDILGRLQVPCPRHLETDLTKISFNQLQKDPSHTQSSFGPLGALSRGLERFHYFHEAECSHSE